MSAKKKRTRRTPEQMIADLEARIAEVKSRAERKKVARDPALRHVKAAVRSIDKAMDASSDAATRKVLEEARTGLAACLTLKSVEGKGSRGVLSPQPRRSARVDPQTVLEHLVLNPGSRSEQIAAALGTDTKALRPALQKLKAEGQARTEGKGRATSYFAST
jgi:hypothetical protein